MCLGFLVPASFGKVTLGLTSHTLHIFALFASPSEMSLDVTLLANNWVPLLMGCLRRFLLLTLQLLELCIHPLNLLDNEIKLIFSLTC